VSGRRRTLVGVALGVSVLVASAGPAAADPVGPTNYRSDVTAVTPASDGVDVDVLGGDAFLRVTVAPGHEVLVPGYDTDEDAAPYLRFRGDGTVEVNTR